MSCLSKNYNFSFRQFLSSMPLAFPFHGYFFVLDMKREFGVLSMVKSPFVARNPNVKYEKRSKRVGV
jgi:hypothetical protein